MAKKVAKKTRDAKGSKSAGPKGAATPSKKAGGPEAPKSKKAKAAPVEEEKELPQMNQNEEEADEDMEEATAARSAAPNASAAAAAATAPTAETSAAFKNFRHHPDMENFYRFIYENDLRYEALQILDEVIVEKRAKRAAKLKKPH